MRKNMHIVITAAALLGSTAAILAVTDTVPIPASRP
jgi:hypothetical protein